MHLFMILWGVFHLSAVRSAAVKQDAGVIAVTAGNNVTLKCSYDSQVAMHFSWYRQIPGSSPELLSTVYKYDRLSKVPPWMEKNPRFSLQRSEGINHLHISDVQVSDSAMYFCGSSHSNMVEFGEGAFLRVEGANLKEIDGPASKNVQQGGSVTLDCTVHTSTCDDKPSVYWFRQGSHKGILHTQAWGGCKQVSTSGSLLRSCVYHLQKVNLSSSDAGTYYCAVASCGEILFGKGSKVFVTDDAMDQMSQMRILVLLSIIRAGLLVLFVTVCFLVYLGQTRKCPS